MREKKGRWDLNGFRIYLDELRALQVPIEWANEAVHLMLAMERVIRRLVSGLLAELHYLAPAPPPVQPPVVQRSQLSVRQPIVTDYRKAQEGLAQAEAKYQMKLREKPSQVEPVHKKRQHKVPEISEEEEEEEEDEERSSTSSGYDDSTDDPGYKRDQREEEDDDEEDNDDAEWFDD
ncbi:uncharacterized protein LOC131299669 [Rhododendron vialii]|uniref:uncharacterized protein LOC131299669 n=1 Tax=Rhododendron vialii TaxID=182163 RepID=UPI00265DA6B7|nr:uncharacterized protein LOC131299669 [Rhododendron vialii]